MQVILYNRSAAVAYARRWTGVEPFYNFLVNNQSIGPFGHTVSQREVEPGDIVQLGTQDGHFYHTPIITSVFPTILVAAHDDDALDRPLSSYRFERVRFLHIDWVRAW